MRERLLAEAATVRVPARCDVAVVGGSAAGLAAAVAAAEAGARVVVLEAAPECGRSILATGNGRCNLGNARLDGPSPDWSPYNDPAFVAAVCGPTLGQDLRAFWEGCGLAVVEEGEGRLYPASRQAASVRDVLLARARRAGALLAPARAVTSLAPPGTQEPLGSLGTGPKDPTGPDGPDGPDDADGPAWRVGWEDGFGQGGAHELRARAVVVACGGGAGLLGALDTLGLARNPWQPVLCPLACEPETTAGGRAPLDLAPVDGRRAHVVAHLLRGGREVAREAGEALLRPWGVSGIVAFDLSRVAREGDVLELDLTAGLDATRAAALARAAGGLEGLVDPAIAHALEAAYAGNKDAAPGDALDAALELARHLRLRVLGPAETDRAQVMRGGLLTSQFDPATLGARALPGLFAAGEALDVDAACGGFNLSWSWASGLVAGAAAARDIGDSRQCHGPGEGGAPC